MRCRKAVCALMTILCLALSGCGGVGEGAGAEQLALDIRREYLEMTGCTAQVEVMADYGIRIFEYTLDVTFQRQGETVLTVTAPQEIAGVTARMAEGTSTLEYDGVQVETGPLTGEGLSPMECVPLLLHYTGEGFIAQCGREPLGGAEALRVICREPEAAAGEGLECSLWFQPDSHTLLQGELSQDGYTVLRCVFSNFQMQ